MKQCRLCRLKARTGIYCHFHFVWEVLCIQGRVALGRPAHRLKPPHKQ